MSHRPIAEGRLRRFSAIAMLLLLTGCAGRPGPEVLVPVAATPDIKRQSIYVATTRKRTAPSENAFTSERANMLNFARFTVAIPPNHRAGNIEWPDGEPDPSVSFATIDRAMKTEAEFRDEVAPRRHISRGGKKRNVLIFVHGYNNNFQESLYRMAQIVADSDVNAIPILFSWPSQGVAAQYAADKEAAAYSRDYLIELLTMLAGSPQVGEIIVAAHSMGAMLTVEALHELRATHRDRVIARLGRIALAAPDIDANVFRSQMQTIGPLKPPLTILASKDDTALKLSSIAGGSRVRAGALDVANPLVREAALKAKVRIIDISQLSSSDAGMGHNRFINLATFYPQLQRLNEVDRQRSGAFMFDPANAAPAQSSVSAAPN